MNQYIIWGMFSSLAILLGLIPGAGRLGYIAYPITLVGGWVVLALK